MTNTNTTREGQTPRTDAEALWPASNDNSDTFDPNGAYVFADFARTLERELAQARARCAELEGLLCALPPLGGRPGLERKIRAALNPTKGDNK